MGKRSKTLYLIKITLCGIEPRIWRRFVVPGDTTFGELHDVVQVVMGWADAHLHDFQVGDEHFGFMDKELDLPWETHSEDDFELAQQLGRGDKFRYLYDFGDEWDHELVVESVLATPTGTKVDNGLCLDGARACPPEDCGGPSGYEALVRILGDEADDEHDDMTEWASDWDAEVFSVDLINRELA